MNIHWKDWCWRWNSNTLDTWCKELTHLKRPWCWERLKAGEGDDKGWGGWMASLTQRTWIWVVSGIWWCTEKPGMLQSMGSQRVRHDWVTELNWWWSCVFFKWLKNQKVITWFMTKNDIYFLILNKLISFLPHFHLEIRSHHLWHFTSQKWNKNNLNEFSSSCKTWYQVIDNMNYTFSKKSWWLDKSI